MLRLQEQPGLGSKALGAAAFDTKLWQMGQRWIAAHQEEVELARKMGHSGRDVYLATEIYEYGGHSALIGDFTRALATSKQEPRLIITDILGHYPELPGPQIQSRLEIAPENIRVLTGPTLEARLEQLFQQLLEWRPARLFLFHHPHDPLPAVVCQSEIAPQCVLVHHADSIPSFGLFLPALQIIDLNPVAVATSRWLGLNSRLLMPTAPDPGKRAGHFLENGNLITATSGPEYKFSRIHAFSYPETVGVILKNTGGWHLHAGPLNPEILDEIERVLSREQIGLERFRHFPWVPSISSFLWEHQCDLYFSSFPVDGARTNAEVLASGIPHLRFSSHPPAAVGAESQIPDGLVWSNWEELAVILRKAADRELLGIISNRMRAQYERMHHPRVFSETLHAILEGAAKGDEPLSPEHQRKVSTGLLKATIHSLQSLWLDTTNSSLAKRLATLENQIARNRSLDNDTRLRVAASTKKHREQIEFLKDHNEKLRGKIDLLQQKRRKLEVKVAHLESKEKDRGRGRGPRAWVWRWLTRD